MTVPSTQSDDLSQALLHNGLDFILEGLEKIESKNPAKMKYALMNTYTGVLLILKERIRLEHWSLLFKGRNEPDFEKYKSGDFESVNFDDCLERLKKVLSIQLNPKMLEKFIEVKKLRNKIEHFQFGGSSQVFESRVAIAVSLALEFIDDHLDAELFEDEEKALLDIIRSKLSLSEKIIEEISERAQRKIDKKDTVRTCYLCDQKFMVVYDGVDCKFCGEKNNDCDSASSRYYEKHTADEPYHPRHNPDPRESSIECPECGSWDCCVIDETNKYLCFSCGVEENSRWDSCTICNGIFIPKYEETACSPCMKDRFDRAD